MNSNKIRSILNILFMILTVVAIVLYFVSTGNNNMMFIYVCGAAIVVKLFEFIIRFTNRYR